jgi:hypothetical protein
MILYFLNIILNYLNVNFNFLVNLTQNCNETSDISLNKKDYLYHRGCFRYVL